MTERPVSLERSQLVTILVIGYIGAVLVWGVGSGLLSVAGLDDRVAMGAGTLVFALLFYPILRTTLLLRGKTFRPTFARWAITWIVATVAGFGLLYPFVGYLRARLLS